MSRRIGQETVVAALIVSGMIACLAVAGVALGEMIVPTWNGGYLVVACTLVSIEAFFTYRLFRAYHLYISGGMKYRLAELFVLLVAFEVVTDLVSGHPPMERGFPRIDLTGLLLFIPVFISWRSATNSAADLDIAQREAASVAEALQQSASGVSAEEIRTPMELVEPAVNSMRQRFFAGGIALFIVAGLSQTQNARAAHLQRPDLAGPLINVLIYFALGIGMMALLQYGTLSVRWAAGRSKVAADLPGRWLRYGLLFLAGAALFAFILPTSYGLDLLGATRGGMESLLSSLGTWIGHLVQNFGLTSQETPRVLPKLPPHPPPHAGVGHRTPPPVSHSFNLNPLLLIRAIFFWLAVAALVVYVVRTVRREHGGRVAPSRFGRLMAWFVRLWAALRGRARSVANIARPRLRRKSAQAAASLAASMVRRRFSSMTARERVVYYFLSIARRLDRSGARRPSQTALELEARVGPELGEAAPDMRSLTQAYLEARYSAHPVGEPDVRQAQTSWKRLRNTLRTRRV